MARLASDFHKRYSSSREEEIGVVIYPSIRCNDWKAYCNCVVPVCRGTRLIVVVGGEQNLLCSNDEVVYHLVIGWALVAEPESYGRTVPLSEGCS
jgi:hypothetical protein